MSDNPGVKSVRDWSLELTEIVLSGDDVQLVDAKVTEITNAARRKGITEAINHLKLRQLANQESCVAMLETARDNIK